MVGKGSTRIHISDTGFMIFSHVSFQGVVGGVLVRAGVVGVVEAASTSDPPSKQAAATICKPLRDDSYMQKCELANCEDEQCWGMRGWERANSEQIGSTQVPLGGAGSNKERVHCQTRPLPSMIREVVRGEL